jgi:hypothetical protein
LGSLELEAIARNMLGEFLVSLTFWVV